MNTRKFFLASCMLVMVALLLIAATSPGERKVENFTGTSVCGALKGETPMVAEQRVRMTGQTQVCVDKMSDARASGTTTVTIFGSLNPKANNTGRLFGTLKTVNANGKWEGTWTGQVDKNGKVYIRSKAVGFGDYNGLQKVSTSERANMDAPGAVKGYIYEASQPIIPLLP